MRSRFFGLALCAGLTTSLAASAQIPSPAPPPTVPAPTPAVVPSVDEREVFVPPPIRQDFRPPPPPVMELHWHRRPPDELKGVEGQRPPEGYHEVRKYQRAPFAIGPVFFGFSYLLSAISARVGGGQSGRQDLWDAMYVPVLGPFITLERARPTFSDDIDSVLLTTVGIFQVAGLGLTIGGFFMPKRILWVMDEATDKEWDRREKEWDREEDEQRGRRRRGDGAGAVRADRASAFSFTLQPVVLSSGGGFGVSGAW